MVLMCHVRHAGLYLSFSFQSVLNVKPVTNERTEEEKVEKHKTFVEKHGQEIKHFGMFM